MSILDFTNSKNLTKKHNVNFAKKTNLGLTYITSSFWQIVDHP
jgi:hypothetical protein